jgi:hypothetical protein
VLMNLMYRMLLAISFILYYLDVIIVISHTF